MNETLKWAIRETGRLMGRYRNLGGCVLCCLLLCLLAGCISLDKHFAKQADLYMRTTGDKAKEAYLETVPPDDLDTRGDIEFQHKQFKEVIRKAIEE